MNWQRNVRVVYRPSYVYVRQVNFYSNSVNTHN